MRKVWERNRWYSLLRPYADAITRLGYRKFRIEGERPPEGAVIIAPNHTNTLMDAMVVLRTRRAPTVFGARSDIFDNPTVAKILRFLRILPMVRRRDGIRKVLRNYEIFSEVDEVLGNNVPFCIFSEGRHRPMHSLLPIGKGISRIAFSSAESRHTIIIPTGIDHSDFFHYMSDVTVRYGEPLDVNAFLEAHKEDTEAAQHQALRDELFQRISSLITYLPDDGTYEARWAEIEARRPRKPAWLRYTLAVLLLPLFLLSAVLTLPMWGLAEYLCHYKVKDAAFRNTVRFGVRFALTPILGILWAILFYLALPWWAATALLLWFLVPAFSLFYDWLNLVQGR